MKKSQKKINVNISLIHQHYRLHEQIRNSVLKKQEISFTNLFATDLYRNLLFKYQTLASFIVSQQHFS